MFSEKADADLTKIVTYIAQSSPQNAREVLRRIEDTADKLSAMPRMGRRRDDLGFPELRTWPAPPCIIVYRDVGGTNIEIVRVAHDRQELSTLLRP